MTVTNVGRLVDAELAGQTNTFTWRKTPTQTTGAGIWFDLSMSPGNPVPNYYAASPGVAIALAQSTDGGIYHGGAVAPATKFVKTFTILTATAAAVPMSMILCDYLMFYPFVDMSITDPQSLTTNISLPRIPSGLGCRIMAVEVAGQSGVGNPQFFVNYTNSDGVSGRQTANVACNTQVVNGTLINSQQVEVAGTRGAVGPFLPLQAGDKGVRSIESVTFLTGDVGLVSFVIVLPVENISLRTIDAPVERNPFTDFVDMPEIMDDAYLNLICCPNGSLSGAILHGYLQTLWA